MLPVLAAACLRGASGRKVNQLIPWEHLGDADIPGSAEKLSLYRRDREYSLRIERTELMNSRMHESEEALARLALQSKPAAGSVLVGGLGMGFTLRAALDLLPATAKVTVAELIPEVVTWNEKYLHDLAGQPLRDARVNVTLADVGAVLADNPAAFDVILLDTDNGPEGTVREDNDQLYSTAGLERILRSLNPGGILAVWSAFDSRQFTERLKRAGFRVEKQSSRARKGKAARHVIWLAHR